MFNLLGKLFDTNTKEVEKLKVLVDQINSHEDWAKKFKDSELKAQIQKFKNQLESGANLDDVLPEVFALSREASVRTLKMRPFDVQLMAGITFHQGKIAEQKTGEGKTLSAVAAVVLNALTGRGVHLVTVNDYLARRDAGWMGPIYHLLGLSVGVIFSGKGDLPAAIYDPDYIDATHSDDRLKNLRPVSRREAYAADITYGTNNEFGFDYLRDNMARATAEMVQRSHHFAIVDEVDSILIDEARTPLIISAPDSEPTEKYYRFSQIIDGLSKDTDYEIDEKLNTANLTEHGLRKVEKIMGVDNLYEKDFDTLHHIEQALKARTLFIRDREYIVKDDQIIIVDEHTGRLMYGRRYSEGLHQDRNCRHRSRGISENLQTRRRHYSDSCRCRQNRLLRYGLQIPAGQIFSPHRRGRGEVEEGSTHLDWHQIHRAKRNRQQVSQTQKSRPSSFERQKPRIRSGNHFSGW